MAQKERKTSVEELLKELDLAPETGGGVIDEMIEEVRKERAAKIKTCFGRALAEYNIQLTYQRTNRRRFEDIDKSYKNRMTAIKEVVRKVLAGDAETLDQFESELTKAKFKG